MTSPFILSIILNPALDRTVIQEGIRKKEKFSAGGKGINVARALKVLGLPVRVVGFNGGISGQQLKKLLKTEKIAFDLINIKGETRINDTFIRQGRIKRQINPGPKVTQKDLIKFVQKYNLLLKRASVVILSGRLIPGAPNNFYKTLILLANQQDKKVYLDTSGVPLSRALSARPYLIKPNRQEIEEVSGLNWEKAVSKFKQRGAQQVIVSFGENGAYYFNGLAAFKISHPVLKIGNPVGCGDAFLAGFIAGEMKGKSLPEALQLAAACGACNLLASIPGKIKIKDVSSFVPKVKVRKV